MRGKFGRITSSLGLVLGLWTTGAFAGPFSAVIVYGDSLSDNGNLFAVSGQPGPPYYMGRASNGPLAPEQMAAVLGSPLLDFAWSGATTGIGNLSDGGTQTTAGRFGIPGMQTEYAGSRSSIAPYASTALFIVWGGPNDFLTTYPAGTTPAQIVSQAVKDEQSIVAGLLSQGAQHILVPGMPDLGLTPVVKSMGAAAAAQATAVTNAYNAALAASLPAGVQFFDTGSLLRSIVASPGQYGLSNVTDPCLTGAGLCANPGSYLFFDNLHPTTQANALLAQQFFAVVVPEPSSLSLLVAGFGGAGAFCWRRRLGRRDVMPE